jgi:hypothetical protein
MAYDGSEDRKSRKSRHDQTVDKVVIDYFLGALLILEVASILFLSGVNALFWDLLLRNRTA